MAPSRRRYLHGIGVTAAVGLAGCAGSGGPGGSDTPADDGGGLPDGGSDTRPEGTGGPGVTVVSTDGDVALPVRPGVEVVREAATDDNPPRLRTTLANERDEPIRVGEGRAVHFEFVVDDAGALVLLPPDGYPADPGCWRLTDDIATTQEYRTVAIDAGASSGRPVDLYARPGEDACLPVGEYRFETTISVVSAEAEVLESADWGFTILLE
jgi:hypothetical protein